MIRQTDQKLFEENVRTALRIMAANGIVDDRAHAIAWLVEVQRELYRLLKRYGREDKLAHMPKNVESSVSEKTAYVHQSDSDFVVGHAYFVRGKAIEISEIAPRFGWKSGSFTIYDIHNERDNMWREHQAALSESVAVLSGYSRGANHKEHARDIFIEEYTKNYERSGRNRSALMKRVASTPRAANCYNCKLSLRTDIFLECSTCGWMVCFCGACGCQYEYR